MCHMCCPRKQERNLQEAEQNGRVSQGEKTGDGVPFQPNETAVSQNKGSRVKEETNGTGRDVESW